MQAVILAGGLGTRLRPLTYTIPKPVLPVANKPAMLHTIEMLAEANFSEVIITTNFLAEAISDCLNSTPLPIPVHCVREDQPLGTAGCVKNVIDRLEDDFLVIQGDAVSDLKVADLVAFGRSKDADVTISVMNVQDTREFGIVAIDEDSRILRFQEKPKPEEAFSNLANSGYYFVKKRVFDDVPNNEIHDFSLHLFPALMAQGARFYAWQQESFWIDIGRINNFLEGNLHLIQGRSEIAPDVQIPESATLVPPFLIGPGAQIGENCVVGPHAILGQRANIGDNARLSGSVLFQDVTVGDGSRLNDCVVASGCTLGENVNVESMAVIGEGCVIGNSVQVRAHSKLGPIISVPEDHIVDGVISPRLEKIEELQHTLERTPQFSGLTADQLKVCALLAECGELSARVIAESAEIPFSKIHSILYPLEVQSVILSTADMPKRYALANERLETRV